MTQAISPTRLSIISAIVALCVVASSCGSEQSDAAAELEPAASTSDDAAEQAQNEPTEAVASESDNEADHDDLIVDMPASCIANFLGLADLWVEEPKFGEVRDRAEGSGGEVDVVAAKTDRRAPAAVEGPIENMTVRTVMADVVAASPTPDGPAAGFFVSHADGFSMGGLIDVDGDSIFAWTACDDDWQDVTAILTEWAESDDPVVVLEQLVSLVTTAKWAPDGAKVREDETTRIAMIQMGILDPPRAWVDREPHSRTWLDDDLPDELADRLASMLIRIDGVERVDNPDLAVCPVQESAGVGYCFGIDALADVGPEVAIEIAVNPDESVVLMLARESLWDQPGHEVVLGKIDGT
jgi:hypothetical protein